jgi:regulation of enolase protein 1 (concanavalin A-like superfamily)
MRTDRLQRTIHLFLISALIAILDVGQAMAQTTWSLPSPWSAQDIGSPAIAGSPSVDQGQFTITAAGIDIWGSSDQFTFVYQQVTGDVDVIARVDSVTMANAWSKAGVMIRGSLAANAAHGFALVSAGKGVAFQRRSQDSALSTNTYGSLVTAPYWVRLVRLGARITAYSSADGTTWATIDSATIALGSVAYVGLATTSHNALATTTAALSQVAVVSLSLPSSQQATDIGAPAIAGSVAYRQGVYTVHAAGTDIWDTSDQFHFVYQPVSGDVEVVARVRSITYADKWSKSGVMIRESLNADSRHAFALASAGKGYAFQRRVDTGGLSLNTAGSASAPPGWVRLVRVGSRIEAFQSLDGMSWTSIGSEAIPMADTVFVGIATTSHNAATATNAVLENLSITPIGSVTNQPPQITLIAPTDGSTFTAGSNVTVSAAASDTDGTVSRVDFFSGSTPIGTVAVPPYALTWQAVPAGAYSLTAVATDNAGATTTSAAVSIRVDPAANQPPAVTLTAPADGATYTAPATVTMSATASDAEGTIARVEFYNGATLLNTDTTAPYAFTWSSVAAGTYAVRAVAYDNAGASGSSATATVTITAAGLPAGQQDADIGAPALSGSATYDNGSYTLTAGGTGVWGAVDQFHYVYQQIPGDLDAAVHVTSVSAADSYSNAGLMIRESLLPGARHAYVLLSAGRGYSFNQRLDPNGVTTGVAGPGPAPGWVRLTRAGSLFTAYRSTDGQTWTAISSVTIAMGSTVYVGIAATSNNAAATTTVVADSLSVTQGAPPNGPPAVTLTAPVTGAAYTAPATVTISATASDPEGALARVEFYSGTTLLGTATVAPYSFTWSPVAAGTYDLYAVAYDTAGASATSATSTINVSTATTTPPTGVVFQASVDDATLVTSYELRIFASGADPATAMPIATSDLGKPAPAANGDITADCATFFSSLAPGSYVAAVAAIGAGGASSSSGVAFTR